MAGARDEGAAARNRQVARRGVRFAAAVATALAVGFAPPAVATVGQVDAQQTGTDGFSGLVVGGYNFTGVAQTFTPTRSGLLDRVDLFVSSDWRATLGLKAEIWPTDGGGAPIGPALASTLVPPGGVSLVTPDWVAVQFAAPVLVTAGVRYAIVASADGVEHYPWLGSEGDPYAGGSYFTSGSLRLDSWVAETDRDLAFRTYLVATPGSKADCKAGGWQFVTDAGGNVFKNQGDCVSWIAVGSNNKAG